MTATRKKRPTALALALCLAGCASSQKAEDPLEFLPYNPETRDQEIGTFLTDLDRAIRGWNNLTLSAANDADKRKVRLLAEDISHRAKVREDDLLAQLATGPPFNRMVAASALGFGDSDAALGPLVAALEDSDASVVSNALVGLAMLGRADTPVSGILSALADGETSRIRSNASWALRKLSEAGADTSGALELAREGLLDPEPFVRSQCALLLARMGDTESLDRLELLLFDKVNLVALSSANALAHLGETQPRVKGQVARALAASLDKVDEMVRQGVRRALAELAKANYKETDEWLEWAARLP